MKNRPMHGATSFDALAAFARVAECRSFSEAARQLGVTPSALSHSLRQLEATLNLRLLLDVAAAPRLGEDRLLAHLAGQGVPLGRPVRLLSAGQRRKLALSPLALAPRALWLLDEPFDALDTGACDALAALAAHHVAAGGAIVLTSHQPLPDGLSLSQKMPLRTSGKREQLSNQEFS